MRALLVVNPKATSTNPRTRDVLIRALGSAVDLRVEETRHRGHAVSLGRTAAADGYDLAVSLGGDGTINELVNGMLSADGRQKPALAVIPGGSANVFARDLGLPCDPVEATGLVLEALRAGRRRPISLGHASWDHAAGRYFIFCAGLGFDAEVVRAVEGARGAGFRASTLLYAGQAVRHYFRTDRRWPAMSLKVPDRPLIKGLFMAIVSNVSPWTYLGPRAISPTPLASFETGLDLLGLHRLGMPTMLRTLWQVTRKAPGDVRGRNKVTLHDESEFTLSSYRPIAFQLDGDYLGELERVTFRSIPSALQTVV